MSFNLECDQMDLWQTPTHITFMCYSNEDGGWEGIKYRYIQWVEHHSDGVYETAEDANDAREIVKDHIDKLNSFNKLDFSIG